MPQPDLDLDNPPLVTARVQQSAPDFALASNMSWPGSEDSVAATSAGPEPTNALEAGRLDPPAAPAAMATTQASPPDLAGRDRSAERELLGLAVTMLRFVQHNPGCAVTVPRERYTDNFRRFTLELRRCYADVTTAVFAATVDLPLDLVEDWLCGGRRRVDPTTRNPASHARRPHAARLRSSAADP